MGAPTVTDCFALADAALTAKKYIRAGCVKMREIRWERNQVASVMESGRAVVTDLASSSVKWLSVDFVEIPSADESTSSYGGLNISGFGTIMAFVISTAVFRLNAIKVKELGASDPSGFQTYRIWQNDFPYREVRHGFYEFSLLFRMDV